MSTGALRRKPALPPLPKRAIELLDLLRYYANRTAPLPAARWLAKDLDHPASSIPVSLECLEKRGIIEIETGKTPMERRILVVASHRWTGWSEPPTAPPPRKPKVVKPPPPVASPAPPPPPPQAEPPPAIVGGYRGQRYTDMPGFDALGRTGRPIIGRPGAGFIAREASC